MSTDNEKTNPDELPEIRKEATVMELSAVVANSGNFPDCRTPEKAAVRILAGKEMGVGPIASIIGIRVQAGRVSMDAALIAGVIKRSGRYDYRIPPNAHDDNGCTIHFYENGEMVGVSSFTAADAKKAGLAGKDTWRAYPRNMFFARALTNGARWYCPTIFGGSLYSHEELGYAVDEEGRAAGDGDTASTGGDLCTREQRQEIARLVEAAGKSMVGYLAETGIRLLDELSGYEASREIKKLTKLLEKRGAKTQPEAPPGPRKETTEEADPALSDSQKMLADAQDEARRPSTLAQGSMIRALAEKLEPNEDERGEMLCHLLGKYGGQVEPNFKIAALNHLQARCVIEAMQKAAGIEAENEPPFDADGATSTTPAGQKTAQVTALIR